MNKKIPVLIILLIVVTGFIFEPALAILPSQADQNIAGEHDEAITASQSQPVKIGVLANRGYDIAMQEWGPTADYLNKTLFPLQFTIVPLDFNEIPEAARTQNISFLCANPSVYTYQEYFGLAQRIATLQVPGDPEPQAVFGGVIFTRSDRTDIAHLEDLKGKSFVAVDKTSLGGWHAAWAELLKAGIDPERDLSSLTFDGTHDSVVFAVLAGEKDAGTVRSSQLERMANEKKINLSEIKVLNSQEGRYPHYPYLLSTPLFPEWPFAAVTGTDHELSKDVAIALLSMDPDDPAAKASRGAGWAVPQDHTKVHELLRSLQFPPYDQYGKPTIREVLNQYWQTILAVILGIVILVIILAYTLRTKRRLEESKAELLKTHDELAQSREEILDSIHYAQLIQQSIFPSEEEKDMYLGEYFTIIKPRDIVGGDYYLLKETSDGFFIAVADCTGHGVPGAMMTMMTSTLLCQVMTGNPDGKPAFILERLHDLVQQTLKAQSDKKHLENGLDIALCKVYPDRQEIFFAGGGLPLIIADETGVREIAGDRMHLGFSREKGEISFTDHMIPYTTKTSIYLITDGILDLPGGQHGHGLGRKKLLELIGNISNLPMTTQGEMVMQALKTHQGTWTAKDDLTIIGFKIR